MRQSGRAMRGWCRNVINKEINHSTVAEHICFASRNPKFSFLQLHFKVSQVAVDVKDLNMTPWIVMASQSKIKPENVLVIVNNFIHATKSELQSCVERCSQ